MTTQLDDMFARLRAPFLPDQVSWRIGATNANKSQGLALAYIDARDVADRLDEVCGPANWACSYPHANGKTVCAIRIRCDGEWISKEDGAGDTDHEAVKGALSDAFKRAGARWGIGRYLYDVPTLWVAIVGAGKSWRIADSEIGKLRALLQQTPKSAAALASEMIGEVKKISADDFGAWCRKAVERCASMDEASRARVRMATETRREELRNEANMGSNRAA